MKVVAIIQARMGSSRLPGKVMMDLAGDVVLARCVNRTARSATIDEVVIATTTSAADDAITEFCGKRSWPFFRGNEYDVLDRYYQAAREFHADVVVRITSDCPLIDPGVVDEVVQGFLGHQPDVVYASNALPRRTFPRGLDTEAVRFDGLEQAWRDATNPTWREHVTPYVRHNPNLFRPLGITHSLDYSAMRWTVDTPEDLVFVRRVYDHFDGDCFSWRDVLAVLARHPDYLRINQHVRQKAE